MRICTFTPASLKDFVLLSWLIPGGLAVCASLLAFSVIGWVDYRNATQRIETELNEKARPAARRLSAEILLGTAGSIESVSRVLEQEYDLSQIVVLREVPPCLRAGDESCILRHENQFTLYRPIQGLGQPHFIAVSSPSLSYFGSLKPSLLLWSTLPVLFLLGLGLFAQRLYLRRYIIQPIESLVETTIRQEDPPGHWPMELRAIARNLSESFEAREQAVFGQLARGVVHDIKTLLHSMGTAAEMANEQPEGSYKRAVRLEALLRAATANLPKMRHIIEQTLDGSREITIHPRTQDLVITIQNALEVNRELAVSREVNVSYEGPSSLLVHHDPVQIERAVINIVKNGIEAQEGEHNRERTLRVVLSESSDGNASISVEDSGPGLTQDPGLVFRPLRSRKTHGSGLGLAISRKIVESHSGTISAGRSEALSGARFEIRLPTSEGRLA